MRNANLSVFALVLCCWLHVPSSWSAPSDGAEFAALKKRLAELEEQGRNILRAVEEIRSRIAVEEQTPSAQPSRPAEPAVTWPELASAQSRLKFYGFLRLDLVMDDSRPDNPQSIFFVQSESAAAGTNGISNFTLYPRLTRFGTTFSGPVLAALGGARASGLLELDFNNGGRESRPIPRIRHAWLKLTRGSLSMLAGQTWDLSSPLMPTPNNDTVMWNVGNLGDRRPQVHFVYEPKSGSGQWYFGASAGLPGAVDGRDLDGDGFRDGEQSARPTVQARAGYSRPLRRDGPRAAIGLSGHRGWERTTKPVAGRTDFVSQSFGIDYSLPVRDSFTLRGELWSGRNLSDIRGGAGQGFSPATGALIASRGGWTELALKARKRWTLAPGYSVDDPRNRDLPSGGRTRNRAFYLANRVDFGGGLLLGADYLRWITDYLGLPRGTDNRVNIFLQYSY